MFYYSPILRLPVRFKNPTNSAIPWKWRGGHVLLFSNSAVASPFQESDEFGHSMEMEGGPCFTILQFCGCQSVSRIRRIRPFHGNGGGAMFYYSPIQRLPVHFKNPTNSTIPWNWRGGHVLLFSNSAVASPFPESD